MQKIRLFNNNLKALRETKGFTLTRAAELMKVSKVHLFNVENGYQQASSNLMGKLKEVYKPSVEEWLAYSMSYTKDKDITVDSYGSQKPHKTQNTRSDAVVSISTDGKEVQVEFIWIPRKKTMKLYQLLQLDLK